MFMWATAEQFSVSAAGALSGNGSAGSPLAVAVDNTTIQIVGNQLAQRHFTCSLIHQAELLINYWLY